MPALHKWLVSAIRRSLLGSGMASMYFCLQQPSTYLLLYSSSGRLGVVYNYVALGRNAGK